MGTNFVNTVKCQISQVPASVVLNPIMKTVHLFTISVLAVMCSHVVSQDRFPTSPSTPSPPSPPSLPSLPAFEKYLIDQPRKLLTISGRPLSVWDGRCQVFRRATVQNCPLAFKPSYFQGICNDHDLSAHSADRTYSIYIYDPFAERFDGHCRYGHPDVVCPLVNYSCRIEIDDDILEGDWV